LRLVIAVCVVTAVAVGAIALFRGDIFGSKGSGLGKQFDYNLAEYRKIDPSLISYRQVQTLQTPLDAPRGLAIGPDGSIYVVGDDSLLIYQPIDRPPRKVKLDDTPQAIAVSADTQGKTTIYIATKRYVAVYENLDQAPRRWERLNDRAYLTSIIVAYDGSIFAADASNCEVLRYNPTGEVIGRIGRKDPDRNIPGLVLPSPHLDVAISTDGLLRVTNSGRHRVEAYTFDGDLELSWGFPSPGIDGFCGCCNPTDIAVLVGRQIVTSEKCLSRVKVYDAMGEFLCVVAGPNDFAEITDGMDVAVDKAGRILVLDPKARVVRIFEGEPPTRVRQ